MRSYSYVLQKKKGNNVEKNSYAGHYSTFAEATYFQADDLHV